MKIETALQSGVKYCVIEVLDLASPLKSSLFHDEARHGKALEGLLKRNFS